MFQWNKEIYFLQCCWLKKTTPKKFDSRMSDTHWVYRQHTKLFIIFDPFCLIKLENVVVVVTIAVLTLSVLFIYSLLVIYTLIRAHTHTLYFRFTRFYLDTFHIPHLPNDKSNKTATATAIKLKTRTMTVTCTRCVCAVRCIYFRLNCSKN